ncbi:MAG: 8-amino-7-oxononanoate synthase [Novosphingobium sp. 28-62-57]|uniref:8-amino-7-oxononanoate synthase n=1 Tax=unclassified Novosphingobium TaxID=2644732 RepID=UPI000BDB96B7|nr:MULTISPECIES: 8-amino-7-oxononanoate synthase [unclassified Novosphingobium]OYW48496.1 MAG: 8-amino-7-oxononanoate synthase [Novosphingobium sp. 12-62-10]OYZ09344.1 MAG: 8-amino-7-oxononanoate synthase [Novosphingobium sp. 28-62-57]OZA38635.1 MAG: 8-amino-7-oxononanoate synthase [Novosphingobium sp. 17-62-9]
MAEATTRTGNLWSAHTADLAALGEKARLRALAPRRGVDFASNDYLAMSSSPRLAAAVQHAIARGVPLGSGGSRLLRGNDPEHELLEEEAARFFGSESALFFSAGYAANVALLSTLPQRGDLIVYDELVHASMHEGLRLTRATAVSAAHNDPQSFDDAAREWRTKGNMGRVWLAFETLYSMDGDMAPVADMARVAQRHEAVMLIDEAHATGVFGPDGRGLAAELDGRPDTIVLRTCGKALGCEGALVLAPRVVRDFLVNRGRPFIFSTAPSPLVCAAVREALRILADEPQRREALHDLVAHAERVLAPLGADISGSQILPLVLHEDARTMAVAAALQAQGFDVRGIRPPTVPQGTSRLRISLTLNATRDDVDALGAALKQALQ